MFSRHTRQRGVPPPPLAAAAAALLACALLLPQPAAGQTCREPTHLVTSSDASCRAFCTSLAERAGITANPETYEGVGICVRTLGCRLA